MRLSVGVDLHKKQFTVYWRIEGREGGRNSRYGTDERGYVQFENELSASVDHGYKVTVALESTGNTRYFKSRIEKLGIGVVVVKNQIHGLLLSFGIESARGSLQSKQERRRVQDVLAAQQLTGAAVDPLFETIDRLSVEVKKLEKIIEEKIKDDRVVQLIRTIPGAGLITAATIRSYLDDIRRFEEAKHLSAYAGLVPWVQNSAERERYGRITKRGPNELRTALVQVVLGMVRTKRRTRTYRIMERYDRLKRAKGSGRSIIATARTLSEIIWHMLNRDEPFDETQMKDPEIRMKAREMQAAASNAA